MPSLMEIETEKRCFFVMLAMAYVGLADLLSCLAL